MRRQQTGKYLRMKIKDGVVVRVKQSLFSPVFKYWGCLEITGLYPKHFPSPMREELIGKGVNDAVTCPTALGQSHYDESMVIETRQSNLKSELALKPGMVFITQFNGGELRGTIKAIDGDIVKIDCNHPLVGVSELITTNFILEVRNPTEQDMQELAEAASPKMSIF